MSLGQVGYTCLGEPEPQNSTQNLGMQIVGPGESPVQERLMSVGCGKSDPVPCILTPTYRKSRMRGCTIEVREFSV